MQLPRGETLFFSTTLSPMLHVYRALVSLENMNARDATLRDGEKATLKISHMSAQEVMHLYAC